MSILEDMSESLRLSSTFNSFVQLDTKKWRLAPAKRRQTNKQNSKCLCALGWDPKGHTLRIRVYENNLFLFQELKSSVKHIYPLNWIKVNQDCYSLTSKEANLNPLWRKIILYYAWNYFTIFYIQFSALNQK